MKEVSSNIAIINFTVIYYASGSVFENAQRLNYSILKNLLQSTNADTDFILSFLYIDLVYMYGMSHRAGAMPLKFPWKLSRHLLNSLPAEDVNPECISHARASLGGGLLQKRRQPPGHITD
jgi:hypothetical protein